MVELDQEYFNDAKPMFSEIWSHIPEFKEFYLMLINGLDWKASSNI